MTTLDALAVAGGVPAAAASPKYFAVTAAGGVDGLKQVFESITQQLIKTCDIQLQSAPPDPMKLNVYIDGTVVPQAGPDGWELKSSDAGALPVVSLKGATCAAIEASGASKVQILVRMQRHCHQLRRSLTLSNAGHSTCQPDPDRAIDLARSDLQNEWRG